MGILAGKTAVVTGGASGIGRAASLLFAAEGAAVTVVDIDPLKGREVVQEITTRGGEAIFVPADVVVADACRHAVERTVDAFGAMEILFNNAGIIKSRIGNG
jgi:NAD(P)-dependent dehydrogenase (short-subunit alcohol dehydrogenase family)